ncbi:MAG: tRNA (adenosine(37)-N6)-threonylcarbamoyltransferase complex transferase subunit TsaD, partial [Campylobacter hyointestinalis]
MILGIESSCDDSSVALMKLGTFELKFYKKITQENEHSKYGGVVPELAARLHAAALPRLIEEIKPYFSDIKAIAVTNEPGLSVSLISGVSVAKSLSVALNLPIIAVNHLIGHIYSLFFGNEPVFPRGVLLVSGG